MSMVFSQKFHKIFFLRIFKGIKKKKSVRYTESKYPPTNCEPFNFRFLNKHDSVNMMGLSQVFLSTCDSPFLRSVITEFLSIHQKSFPVFPQHNKRKFSEFARTLSFISYGKE